MAHNLQGQQYGTWRVTARHGTNGNRYATWFCICVRCGSEAVISSKRLRSNETRKARVCACLKGLDYELIISEYMKPPPIWYSNAMNLMHKSLTIILFIPWLLAYAFIGAVEGVLQGLEDWSEWYNESRWM